MRNSYADLRIVIVTTHKPILVRQMTYSCPPRIASADDADDAQYMNWRWRRVWL